MKTTRGTNDHPSTTEPFSVRFFGVNEATPGSAWQSLYDATWESYRAWYLRDGDSARPTLKTARRKLDRHMPELVPIWERLVELADGDEMTARFLTQWNPPKFLPGCSQAVLTGDTPTLVRNYDYHPDLCERVVLSSEWAGRSVIGMSDCLWGLVDGMNDSGLAISLAYGGRTGAGDGFGIPLVVRYLLEMAETVNDASRLLSRLPVSMAYNLTVMDRNADVGTFFVAPDSKPEFFPAGLATNHRGRTPEQPDHARAFRSVERQNALMDAVAAKPEREAFVSRFLSPPLHNSAYEKGFGTMYTAVYQPMEGVVEYVWPDSRWERTYDSPTSTHDVRLGAGIEPIGAVALTPPLVRVDTGGVKSKGTGTSDDELAEIARDAISALAASRDSAAFTHLLELSQHLGESLGESARNLAAEHSWAGVADYAGTSRQAAWARWNAP